MKLVYCQVATQRDQTTGFLRTQYVLQPSCVPQQLFSNDLVNQKQMISHAGFARKRFVANIAFELFLNAAIEFHVFI